jgi:hypothetical protein
MYLYVRFDPQPYNFIFFYIMIFNFKLIIKYYFFINLKFVKKISFNQIQFIEKINI